MDTFFCIDLLQLTPIPTQAYFSEARAMQGDLSLALSNPSLRTRRVRVPALHISNTMFSIDQELRLDLQLGARCVCVCVPLSYL